MLTQIVFSYGVNGTDEPTSFTANFNSDKNEYTIEGIDCVQRKIN